MAKTGFHTYDIFNNEDVVTRWKYFNFCHKKALNCGLVCRCNIKDSVPKLELWGTKCQFLKYYLQTLTKCQYKLEGVKRCISFLFE